MINEEELMGEDSDGVDIGSDDDSPYEVDSNGKRIASENNLMRSFTGQLKIVNHHIYRLEKLLESGSLAKINYQKDLRLQLLGYTLQTIDMIVRMLLRKGSKGSRMDDILKLHEQATADVSAIKAKYDALDQETMSV